MPSPPHIDSGTGLAFRGAPKPYPFGPPTVAAVLKQGLRDHPDRVALVHGSMTLTYTELDGEVTRTAAAIGQATDADDVVAWCLPNSIELVVGFLATLRAGRVWLGLNPRMPEGARAALVERSDAAMVVSEAHRWSDDPRGRAAEDPSAPTPIDPHAPAAMSPTSGTTGEPKLVVHSQHGLLWPGLASRETEPIQPGERTLCSLPLTTLPLMILGPLTALLRGATVVLGSGASPDAILDDVRRHRVTRLVAVPTILHDLAEFLAGSGDPPPPSLGTVLVGGAGTTPELRERFEQLFDVRAVLSYGLSETPTGVARTAPEHPHSATPMPPVRITIHDDVGAEVTTGATGRIRIDPTPTGPWADSWRPMLGYWRDPSATAAALDGDGLLTEDLGRLDADGRLQVVGRCSDLIVRGGTNVVPAEVERALLTHPEVREVAVVGLPDDRLGERIAAAVVSDDASLTAGALRDHARTLLTGDRLPTEVAFVGTLPRNAMGKVVRQDVVDIFASP